MNSHAHRGFSLVELLIVVTIIALLSTVVIGSITSARIKGQDNSVKSAMKQMAIQAETYRLGNDDFGKSISSLAVTNCAGGVFDDVQVDNIEAGILKQAAPSATLSCTTDSTGNFWSVLVSELRGGGTWCVDNQSGFKASALNTDGKCQ